MRGKRFGSVQKVENLNADAPAATMSGICLGAIFRIDRRIEREIDARLRAGLGDLLLHALAGANQKIGVIGHVDDGGDAAGRRGARGPDEILLILLRTGMHLRIDRARQHIGLSEIVTLARLRRRAVADPRDAAIADSDIAIVDDALGA